MTNKIESPWAYQVGGSLSNHSPTYVERQADRELYQSLTKGEFCYVFNSRQMGKSSLRLRIKHLLQQEGYCCASIDLTMIGGENVTPKQWYLGLASELWRSFRLVGKINLKTWWRTLEHLSPVQKFSRFLEDVVLQFVPGKIVIFIDEIDSVKSLDFTTDDLFALIRFCYNQRAENLAYQRLNWALFGVTTPSDLISDNYRTPFNIGKAIELRGFQLQEIAPLAKGLEHKFANHQAVLKEILVWSGGQPFLTQKICKLVVENNQLPFRSNYIYPRPKISSRSPFLKQLINEVLTNHSDLKVQISTLVKGKIIDNWKLQDCPEHLKTIGDRLVKQSNSYSILKLYQQVLQEGSIKPDNSSMIVQLLLSGVCSQQEGEIKVTNPIYAAVFNQKWVENQLAQLRVNNQPVKGDSLDQLLMANLPSLSRKQLEALMKAIAKNYPDKAKVMLTTLSKALTLD